MSHVGTLNGSAVASHTTGNIGGVSMAPGMAPIGTVSSGMTQMHNGAGGATRGIVPQQMPQQASSMMSSIGIGVETPQSRTLWIGDIGPYIDENFLHSLFAHTGEVTQVKVIRDKNTGLSAGYGFVEFANHYAAKRVLEVLNGQQLPTGDGKVYRLNWASYGINERRADAAGPEYSLFVGDLAPEVNDFILQQTFAERYKSIKSAKVVTDSQTGMSRRYGFVRFFSEEEMHRALVEMQGELCAGRPMRINHATPRRQDNTQPSPPNGQQAFERPEIPESADPNNTTVFIGNLDSSVNEEDLKAHFEPYGELIYVKIPIGKGCGFVQFTHRRSAEAAFEKHGSLIGRQRVRLSWGRSSKKNQTRTAFPGAAMRPQVAHHGQTQSHYDPLQPGSGHDDGQSVFSAAAFGGFPTPATHQVRPQLHGASQLRTEYSASQSPPQQLRQVQSSQLMHQQAIQPQSLHGQQQSQLYYRDPTSILQQQFQRLQLAQQPQHVSPQQLRRRDDMQHLQHDLQGQHMLSQAPSQGQSQQGRQQQTQHQQQQLMQAHQQQLHHLQSRQQAGQRQPMPSQGQSSQAGQTSGQSSQAQGQSQAQSSSVPQVYGHLPHHGAFTDHGFDHGFEAAGSTSPMGQHRTAPGQYSSSGYGQASLGYGSHFQANADYVGDSFTEAGGSAAFAQHEQDQHNVGSFLFDDDDVVGPFMAPFSASSKDAPADDASPPASGSPPSSVGTIGTPSRAPRPPASSGEANGSVSSNGSNSGSQLPYIGQFLSTHVY